MINISEQDINTTINTLQKIIEILRKEKYGSTSKEEKSWKEEQKTNKV